jgi:hypothetical protein
MEARPSLRYRQQNVLKCCFSFAANFAVVAASYAFAFATDSDDDDDENDSKKPEWLKFIYKSLDFGTGKERGARQ